MHTLLAGALIAGLTLGYPVVVTTAPTPADGLEAIQMRAERATNDRIRAIDRALDRLESNESLTEAHRETITSTLTAHRAAMQTLQADIAAESQVGAALESYQSIFTDYRVFVVSLPQALYAAGADRLTETTIPRLEQVYDTLEDNDIEGLAELRAAIDEAAERADGIADAALAVEPSDYNTDPTVLAELRLELRDATAAARRALEEARDVWEEKR